MEIYKKYRVYSRTGEPMSGMAWDCANEMVLASLFRAESNGIIFAGQQVHQTDEWVQSHKGQNYSHNKFFEHHPGFVQEHENNCETV